MEFSTSQLACKIPVICQTTLLPIPRVFHNEPKACPGVAVTFSEAHAVGRTVGSAFGLHHCWATCWYSSCVVNGGEILCEIHRRMFAQRGDNGVPQREACLYQWVEVFQSCSGTSKRRRWSDLPTTSRTTERWTNKRGRITVTDIAEKLNLSCIRYVSYGLHVVSRSTESILRRWLVSRSNECVKKVRNYV
jgi:hypothetical protein